MEAVDLPNAAANLPAAWSSRLLGQVGSAGVKAVVDGALQLVVDGIEVEARAESCTSSRRRPSMRCGPAAEARSSHVTSTSEGRNHERVLARSSVGSRRRCHSHLAPWSP